MNDAVTRPRMLLIATFQPRRCGSDDRVLYAVVGVALLGLEENIPEPSRHPVNELGGERLLPLSSEDFLPTALVPDLQSSTGAIFVINHTA